MDRKKNISLIHTSILRFRCIALTVMEFPWKYTPFTDSSSWQRKLVMCAPFHCRYNILLRNADYDKLRVVDIVYD